ncbi:biosynthetic-type acetolactate synthase large subunit [Dehalobacterium formicoaceticum]|uniref:Acetolactate synthase n=2 Tax=Dehalobacterium formicoaceticum TaxID=51515 RepID=A0ABT1Y3Z1_9FIRM|nr:biosynthetic-type acetolactate synthase large subunit [Dehalobacterium formicoaceticum]MCR6545600.1 biosynthetic-type acetolactate synthase large subunit [Dehalobacterium formicoaceticum]
MLMTGAQAVVAGLKAEGVELVFGYPGGAALNLYDALYDSGITHILARHEQGAAHAADGYARSTGKVGVCLATSGPGATNLVTGIATANMDSVPMVFITSQVGTSLIGKDSFQEADITGITTPITKHNFLVKRPQDLMKTVKEAFYIARTGRPGPVLIDIPKDITGMEGDFTYPESINLRGYHPLFEGDPSKIEELAAAIKKAKKPMVFVGGGLRIAGAWSEFASFIEKTGIPVVSSLMGLGCFPADHELYLGMLGMHGTYTANQSVTQCDLLIGIGVRFDDRVTGLVSKFAPEALIVHMDIDPAEINKNVRTDIKILGDLKWSLPLLSQMAEPGDIAAWQKQVLAWKQERPLRFEENGDVIKPQSVVKAISDITEGSAFLVTDVGQHQMWAAQYYNSKKPRRFITSGGLGTMGYGLPAAIGAQLGNPDETVWAIAGDGGIMMNIQEIATAVEHQLPIKVVVINNQGLGMVRQWQRIFYDQRYSCSRYGTETDLAKVAEAFGAKGIKVQEPGELIPALQEANNYCGPVFIDVLVCDQENVLPMVPAGAPIDQMIGG